MGLSRTLDAVYVYYCYYYYLSFYGSCSFIQLSRSTMNHVQFLEEHTRNKQAKSEQAGQDKTMQYNARFIHSPFFCPKKMDAHRIGLHSSFVSEGVGWRGVAGRGLSVSCYRFASHIMLGSCILHLAPCLAFAFEQHALTEERNGTR